MLKTILISSLLLAQLSLLSQAPSLVGIPSNNLSGNSLPVYEKFEIDLKLNRQVVYVPSGSPPANTYQTPHDSAEIDLYAIFSNVQTGHKFKIHFFYNEPYKEQANPCLWPSNKQPDAMFPNSSFSAAGNSSNNYLQSWKMRCAFRESGKWNYTIFAKDKFSPDSFTGLYSGSIDIVSNPNNKGFIKKIATNNTYLFFDNGEMCFMNGVNEFFAESSQTFICRMRGQIDKMAANNINFFRMWIEGTSGWYFTSNIQGTSHNDIYSTSIFNQRNAQMLDEIFDYARKKNVYIQPCLYAPNLDDAGFNNGFTNHSAFNIKNDKHQTNRNNTPNVGEITNPWDFYNPAILNYMRNYIKYCVSRWGYSTSIAGWEIGNEINCNASQLEVLDTLNPNNSIYYPQPTPSSAFEQQLYDWHKNFKKNLNYYDAHQHLVTTSLLQSENRTQANNWRRHPLSNEQFKIFGLMDYTTGHNYYINPTCPEKSACLKIEDQEDAHFNSSIVFHEEMPKPTQVQEWGSGDDQCTSNIRLEYYLSDPFGVSHHNVVLSSAFSGSFGTALTFNSFFDLQPSDYYHHYKGIGEFINKFGNLGNPLYVRKDRTLPMNNNAQCKTTDFGTNGLRYYYMANSDKLVLGWCQDKRFSFSRLYWSYPDYLKTLEKRHKPVTENSPHDFTIKVPKKGFYKIKWYNTSDINKFVENESIVRSFSKTPIEELLQLNLPKSLHDGKLADGFFSANYTCERKLNFEMLNGASYHYTDKLPIKLNEFTAIDEVEIIVEKVNNQGQFPDLLFKRKLNAKDFKDSSKRELNYLFNLTNPAFKDIPFLNKQTTYYKLTINPTNPEELTGCYDLVNSGPLYFQIIGCTSLPQLKINNMDGSSLSNPIVVNHGDPIILDGIGSYGGSGYRLILREIDTSNKYLGPEYNVVYDGKFIKPIDANIVVQQASKGTLKYLPSDGNNQFRLYQVYHVNFNNYGTANGCSGWESTSEFVKVMCKASIGMDIQGGGNGNTKEFEYGEAIYLDGRDSKGETGYKIIIQPTDSNGNKTGNGWNKIYKGNIEELIEINSLVKEITNGNFKYLPPQPNGPSYYNVSLIIFNAFGDGGCDEYIADNKTIKIKSCHVEVNFSINNLSPGNSFSNPYIFTYGNPIIFDGIATKGETAYKIILDRLDANGNVLNEYKVQYDQPIADIYNLNEWFTKHVNPASKNFPAYDGSNKNTWLIYLTGMNAIKDQGCDTFKEKHLYFRVDYTLKCDFIINAENPQNHTAVINMLCKNDGTYLNIYNMEYGCDKYTIKIEELELATWINQPSYYVTYERQMKNQSKYFYRRETSETFESSTLNKVDLEELWFRRTGYAIDKSKVYRIYLTTYANMTSCTDYWTINYNSDCQSLNHGNGKNTIDSAKKAATSSLRDINKESDITNVSVYPNPASSIVNVLINTKMLDRARVEISDICSKNVYSAIHNDVSFGIDISRFTSGIYFLKVTINNQFYNFKVIKL